MRRERGLPAIAVLRHWQAGQSLIEVIIAAAVGILVVAALTFATLFSLRNANFAKNSAQATKLAQEGIEKVRTARDRGDQINGFSIGSDSIDSWQNPKLWSNQINGNCGNTTLIPPTYCYFRFSGSTFSYLGPGSDMPGSPEDPLLDGKFKRIVVLSDDSTTYTDQKTATVIVRWSDATGPHDSKLTTILRKL